MRDSCRKCKIHLTPSQIKDGKKTSGRGYLCNACYKKQTKDYADKRKKALKEWRSMYD
jgi:protein-arginine kinase activator protein McsA